MWGKRSENGKVEVITAQKKRKEKRKEL